MWNFGYLNKFGLKYSPKHLSKKKHSRKEKNALFVRKWLCVWNSRMLCLMYESEITNILVKTAPRGCVTVNWKNQIKMHWQDLLYLGHYLRFKPDNVKLEKSYLSLKIDLLFFKLFSFRVHTLLHRREAIVIAFFNFIFAFQQLTLPWKTVHHAIYSCWNFAVWLPNKECKADDQKIHVWKCRIVLMKKEPSTLFVFLLFHQTLPSRQVGDCTQFRSDRFTSLQRHSCYMVSFIEKELLLNLVHLETSFQLTSFHIPAHTHWSMFRHLSKSVS